MSRSEKSQTVVRPRVSAQFLQFKIRTEKRGRLRIQNKTQEGKGNWDFEQV